MSLWISKQPVIKNNKDVYQSIIKPIWTYGIQLWGAAWNPNLEIILKIRRDLVIETVKKEIERYSEHYEERLMLEFLNAYESFTLVLTKITRHRTPSTERDEGMQL